jgi:transposase
MNFTVIVCFSLFFLSFDSIVLEMWAKIYKGEKPASKIFKSLYRSRKYIPPVELKKKTVVTFLIVVLLVVIAVS